MFYIKTRGCHDVSVDPGIVGDLPQNAPIVTSYRVRNKKLFHIPTVCKCIISDQTYVSPPLFLGGLFRNFWVKLFIIPSDYSNVSVAAPSRFIIRFQIQMTNRHVYSHTNVLVCTPVNLRLVIVEERPDGLDQPSSQYQRAALLP